MNRFTTLVACSTAACVLLLPGCYKAQYETEQSRANDLEKKSADLQKQLEQAQRDFATATARTQALETQLSGIRSGGTLVGFIDGKPAGTESIRWDGTQWVRHGDCTRPGGVVKFENGRLADQTLFINQPGGRGKPWYTGAVKFGKPDGDWIWFDADGRPQMRETWAAGRLVEVSRASTAKGPLTWGKLSAKDREAWVKSTAAAMHNLPELLRDTSVPPPPPASTPSATPAAKPKR